MWWARAAGGRGGAGGGRYAGGGIGAALAAAIVPSGFAVGRLCVRAIPRSGTPEQLVDRYGISARQIVAAVRK